MTIYPRRLSRVIRCLQRDSNNSFQPFRSFKLHLCRFLQFHSHTFSDSTLSSLSKFFLSRFAPTSLLSWNISLHFLTPMPRNSSHTILPASTFPLAPFSLQHPLSALLACCQASSLHAKSCVRPLRSSCLVNGYSTAAEGIRLRLDTDHHPS